MPPGDGLNPGRSGIDDANKVVFGGLVRRLLRDAQPLHGVQIDPPRGECARRRRVVLPLPVHQHIAGEIGVTGLAAAQLGKGRHVGSVEVVTGKAVGAGAHQLGQQAAALFVRPCFHEGVLRELSGIIARQRVCQRSGAQVDGDGPVAQLHPVLGGKAALQPPVLFAAHAPLLICCERPRDGRPPVMLRPVKHQAAGLVLNGVGLVKAVVLLKHQLAVFIGVGGVVAALLHLHLVGADDEHAALGAGVGGHEHVIRL